MVSRESSFRRLSRVRSKKNRLIRLKMQEYCASLRIYITTYAVYSAFRSPVCKTLPSRSLLAAANTLLSGGILMKNVFGLSSRLVLSALLGLSLTTWLSLGPVLAQGKMKKDKSASKDKMMKKEAMMSDDHMMKDHMMMSDEDVLPVAPSYPNAPPGGLDLYHWTDFTKKHMKEGSAMSEKMDKMHDKMM